jgi:hypothetical protein
MIRIFVLYGGYVESSSNGCLVLHHRTGFETVLDGLRHLGQVFKIAAEWEHAQKDDRPVCPHCSKPIREWQPVGEDEIRDLFLSYAGGVTDGNLNIWEILDEHGWGIGFPEMAFNEPVAIVNEISEEIVAALAMGDEAEKPVTRIKEMRMGRFTMEPLS